MDRTQRLISQTNLPSQQAILVHKTSNIFYLSGYTGEGLLLLTHDIKAIITDFRYIEQASNQAPGFAVHSISNEVNHINLAAQLLRDLQIKELLYEDDCLTVKGFHEMQDAMSGISFSSLDLAPEKLRTIKDQDELSLIGEAFLISTQAFDYILGFIKVGLTEKQIQLALNFKMFELGAQALAFDSIVASGPNGSLPHAIPGLRAVQKGDLITLDFGAKYQGYCADMTRTVAVGEPSEELRHIYATVLQAQTVCQDALAPGKDCRAIDRQARDIIDSAGYGKYFGHGLGHSLGIDVHENPRLSPTSTAQLEPGIVITVEPGIYVPGLGGVRIENSCVITQTGANSLVNSSRELIVL